MCGWWASIPGERSPISSPSNRTPASCVAPRCHRCPSDPSAAVLDAMDKLFAEGIDPADISLFVHGTTVATNALLEGKGVRTGLLITRGFRAVYEARGWSQPRGSDLLDTFYQKPPLLAPQWLTEEVRERLDYRGEVVTAARRSGAAGLRAPPEGEGRRSPRRVLPVLVPQSRARAARRRDRRRDRAGVPHLPVVERAAGHPRISAAVDDRDRCLCRSDHRRLSDAAGAAADRARLEDAAALSHAVERRPDAHLARRASSQPDAAVGPRRRRDRRRGIGARHAPAARHHLRHGRHLDRHQRHRRRAVAGDHAGPDRGPGHRHADAARAHARGGRRNHRLDRQGRSAQGRPQERGLGAGTRLLRPRRRGADGHRCQCRPRRAQRDTVLAGSLRLDAARAARAIETVAKPLGLDVLQGAAGILRIVNTQMAVDLRLALQEQGQDPRKFALVAFGGAGPLHAAALARSVGIPDRAGSAVSRAQLRHRHAADQRAPLLSQVRGRRAQPFPDAAHERPVPRAPAAGAGGGERGGIRARRREAHPPPRSALSASGLHLAGRVSGRDRRRRTRRGSSRPSTMCTSRSTASPPPRRMPRS